MCFVNTLLMLKHHDCDTAALGNHSYLQFFCQVVKERR